jgi:hypothetical protein
MSSNVRIFPRSPSLPVLEGVKPERVLEHLDKHNEIEMAILRTVGWKADEEALWGSTEKIERAVAELRNVIAAVPKMHVVSAYSEAIRQSLDLRTEATLLDQVGDFLVSWPNATPPDPAAFAGLMIRDLADEGFADCVLVQAFRNVRRTSKFMPSIAEVIDECRAVVGRWRCAQRNAERVEAKRTEMQEALKAAEHRLNERRARGDGPRPLPLNVEAALRQLKAGDDTATSDAGHPSMGVGAE